MDNNYINSKENISFFLLEPESENEQSENVFCMQELLDEFNKEFNTKENIRFRVQSYNEDYENYKVNSDYNELEKCTVNALHKICEYYNLLKYVKMAKYKKNEIIQSIIMFESDENNNEIVKRRHKLWRYMNELCKDKFMKKYIIWNQ